MTFDPQPYDYSRRVIAEPTPRVTPADPLDPPPRPAVARDDDLAFDGDAELPPQPWLGLSFVTAEGNQTPIDLPVPGPDELIFLRFWSWHSYGAHDSGAVRIQVFDTGASAWSASEEGPP